RARDRSQGPAARVRRHASHARRQPDDGGRAGIASRAAQAGVQPMKKILHVVGARPNYMKIAPLMEALKAAPHVTQRLVDTGQHYDENMAGSFFSELRLPRPDRSLGVGSGSHASQTARVMIGFEEVCLDEQPDLVVVVGDVNSTMAAAIVAAK